MRKIALIVSVAALIAVLLSSCTSPVPTLESFSMLNGAYVDPREDLKIAWSVQNLPDDASFRVFLNGEKLGTTSKMSYTITSEELDWGRDYTFKVEVVSLDGEVLTEGSVNFKTYAGVLELYAVDANSGPAVEGVNVFVNGEEVGTTDSEGRLEVLVKESPAEILLKKDGYALSAVKGLKVEGEYGAYKVIIRKAQINPDPSSEELPTADVGFYTDASKTTVADLDNLEKLYVVVNVTEGSHPIRYIYFAAGKIPGAGFFGKRVIAESTISAEDYVDLSGLEGEVEIHVVIYDFNDNRVDYIFYANVVKEGETALEKYQVIRWSDFGSTNVYAYTRRSEVEFYSFPIDPKKARMIEKFGGKIEPLAAPKDSNLWVEVWFVDYDLAAYYFGMIDPDEIEKPEAYVIYRSFDGVKWEKAGVVADTSVFRDTDPRLAPGKKVYYRVAAYYPDGESTPVDLGYVVPLDVFNVDLISPEDGATGVSRDPTFVWKPTNDAFAVIPDDVTYDGTYTYTLWIYDFVQSENHLFPYDPDSPLAEDVLPIKLLTSSEANQMSLQFSDVDWAIIAYDFDGVYLYPYDKLEPNKTYEWAVDLAYAYAEFKDEDGNVVGAAYSVAIDEGYGADYFGVDADIFNTFTTGQE